MNSTKCTSKRINTGFLNELLSKHRICIYTLSMMVTVAIGSFTHRTYFTFN